MRPLISTLLLTYLLASCGNAPANHYFILSPVPNSRAAASPLVRAAVHLPALLDRVQLVVQTGPDTVSIREFERWAEPLDQMVPRVLNEDIAFRAAGPTLPATVDVDVGRFIADAAAVHLDGAWQVNASGRAGAARAVAFSFAVPLDAAAGGGIAAGMSDLLGRLADQIVVTVRSNS